MLPNPVAVVTVRHRGHPGIVEESPYHNMAPPRDHSRITPTEAGKKKAADENRRPLSDFW
jgi:hypothetical protein